jgi:hypothetical protein
MADQWRDVSGYDGIYQVSDQGHVRNTHTNKILQPTRMKNGRLYVTLSSDGVFTEMYGSWLGRRFVSRRLPGRARDNAQGRRLYQQCRFKS